MERLNNPKHKPEKIIKEFAPGSPDVAQSAGRLILRSRNYGSSLAKFEQFFTTLAADAKKFDPPLEVRPDDVEVVHYGGGRIKRTFGLELDIPASFKIPDDYERISHPELTL